MAFKRIPPEVGHKPHLAEKPGIIRNPRCHKNNNNKADGPHVPFRRQREECPGGRGGGMLHWKRLILGSNY